MLRGLSQLVYINKGQFQKRAFSSFQIDPAFVAKYEKERPPFGFNGLGEMVYIRTYSREKDDGGKEKWAETIERVVNGCFSLQSKHMEKVGLKFNDVEAQVEAQKMFDRMFHMKFLPPGRGLWAMGSSITEKKGLYAALNNCAFVSTKPMSGELSDPFCFLMDACMLGVGVGFDTKGAGTFKIQKPLEESKLNFIIEDSREGWVDSLRVLLNSYFVSANEDESYCSPKQQVNFDYSKIRAQGQPIKGFGGTSSGPEPLRSLHEVVGERLKASSGKLISVTLIVDIMNLIGKTVVSGNVRRTAEIAFGNYADQEYVDLKNYEKNPDRQSYGWTSNNSVFADIGMDYESCAENIVRNGEPGFAWAENMRKFSRMKDAPDYKDDVELIGGNPCLEQTLESYELCCLVETFPAKHENLADFQETLRLAFLYAKTVTLADVHWENSREVMNRNRRIGCSLTGIRQFLAQHDDSLEVLKHWCNESYGFLRQYDGKLSAHFGVPESKKITSVKPSGTVSLVAGATPGVHMPESRFYIRRVRLAVDSPLVQELVESCYPVELDVYDPSSAVVSFPVDVGEGVETLRSTNYDLWDQLNIAAVLQEYWADNQVSCTVTFSTDKGSNHAKKEILQALEHFQHKLKGVSFLPKLEAGAFEQMPYEEITEEEYHEINDWLLPLDFEHILANFKEANSKKLNLPQAQAEFCDSDQCEIKSYQVSSRSP